MSCIVYSLVAKQFIEVNFLLKGFEALVYKIEINFKNWNKNGKNGGNEETKYLNNAVIKFDLTK